MFEKIDTITFHELEVDIYHSKNINEKDIFITFESRNPDSFYKGYVYLNHNTGKIDYPKDVIIPKQTIEDRENIPKSVVVGDKRISRNIIQDKMEESWRERNIKNYKILKRKLKLNLIK